MEKSGGVYDYGDERLDTPHECVYRKRRLMGAEMNFHIAHLAATSFRKHRLETLKIGAGLPPDPTSNNSKLERH